VVEVSEYADAVVVGSAIVQTIQNAAADGTDVASAVGHFVKWLRGAGAPA
jgi:tryptophan synthase alpha subunit